MRGRKVLRLAVEALILGLLYYAGLWAMDYWGVMESLLTLGSCGHISFAVSFWFLLLRLFIIIVAPGWFFARLILLLRPRRNL